ncbi:RNA dependent RNA polymerase-domain-containing protein [Durotheca rogersii]|uniref:RNA dependent RNA polymerase-domain-containing protein n=1 Tax=Durotheca rogersii TaxID=419775 RepID=UPI00221E5834|nr:RNA dependent RNA polymerase-domain-containing protein [Durotheca rogersii]KAI5868165.1 RNA dependent RNA polymerase-domain-containing protein [Durotheca rogersii]
MTRHVDPGPGVLPVPSTPGREHRSVSDFDIWFLEFSNAYSLSLRRSPPNLSPKKKRDLPYYRELEYYERLKAQYFRGNHAGIQALFDQKAKEIHGRWVKKPHAALGLTPFPTQLPRVTTEPERCQLLNLLKAILDDVGLASVSSRSFTSDSSSHHASESPSSTRHHSKRQPREWQLSPSPKRNRGVLSEANTECDPEDERPPSVLSILDRGRVRTESPLPSRAASVQPPGSREGRRLFEISLDTSISKSTHASRVFSDRPDGDTPLTSQGTQTTAIASSAGNTKPPLLPPPSLAGSDSHSFGVSSGTERALQISLDNVERLLLQQRSEQLADDGSSTYSDFSYPVEQEIERPITPSRATVLPPASPALSSIEENVPDSTPPRVTYTGSQDFEDRLHAVWPPLPPHYDCAPFAIRWELMRISLHCGVQMDALRLEYDPSWTDQKTFWARIQALSVFRGKSFPERSRPDAWAAALNGKFSTSGQVIVLTACLDLNTAPTGPIFTLKLNPLKFDLPHRLNRRFGPDRFLEVVIPSMKTQDFKGLDSAVESIQRWLVDNTHVLLGRLWTSFFIKPALAKKIESGNALRPQTKTIYQERIYMFAEDGNEFHRLDADLQYSPKGESADSHTKMRREGLLDWLLQISNNQGQTVLKLFSRIALGLSRTQPTVIVELEQIRHQESDILSPEKGNGEPRKVMNDGIARMSNALAKAISNSLGLVDVPAGFQGRFGSAKGVWIRDTTDSSDDVWIETFPSQRKWKCDYIEDDHRTFEVRNAPRELRAASLNLQLLPILEDRAIDATLMKSQIGKFMRDSLKRDLDIQRAAMQDPTQFKLWVYENSPSNRREARVENQQVPFTAGLPTNREDIMSFLVDSGFEPTKLKLLREMAWNLRRDKCTELVERLNVRVGRSAYAYMVVDFLGVLEEDEVHLGFSSKFIDEQSGFSETFLHGMDVLVARTPAHYPSDIQRVRAVFKPELGSLKDVIIFPTKGDIPLADKLSGGDYDGDIAWVCWEPVIVNNFRNAEVPPIPDLFQRGIIRKESQIYGRLGKLPGSKDITSEFLSMAFRFNMQQNLLGTCTNYKEKFCYQRNSVKDDSAILLSTLISNLVDRSKQGIVFTDRDWAVLRKSLSRMDPPEPAYKKKSWSGIGEPSHIIDYVKFGVGKPLIEAELKALNESLDQGENFDKDLVSYYQHYEKFQRPLNERKEAERSASFKKSTWERILEQLRKDIDALAKAWHESSDSWDAKITNIYDKWREIPPTPTARENTVSALQQEDQVNAELSNWDLLKASCLFKMYYRRSPKFVWYVAGKQLAFLKSMRVSQRAGASPVAMASSMYAGSRPDAKYARMLAARADGHSLFDSDDDDYFSDDDLADTFSG